MYPEKFGERGRWGTYISLYKQRFKKNNFIETSRVWAHLKGLAQLINSYKRTLCLRLKFSPLISQKLISQIKIENFTLFIEFRDIADSVPFDTHSNPSI